MGFFDFLNRLGKPKRNAYSFKCPYCGTLVSSTDEICPECGLRVIRAVKLRCSKCENLNRLDAPRCEKCGAELIGGAPSFGYRCWVCGYESTKFFSVCPICGTRLV
ncbi:MAG: zinc ribbon domain-containing protein [Candidatus Bilamarchaeaceae archaeon]